MDTITPSNADEQGEFGQFRKTAISKISTFTVPPGTSFERDPECAACMALDTLTAALTSVEADGYAKHVDSTSTLSEAAHIPLESPELRTSSTDAVRTATVGLMRAGNDLVAALDCGGCSDQTVEMFVSAWEAAVFAAGKETP